MQNYHAKFKNNPIIFGIIIRAVLISIVVMIGILLFSDRESYYANIFTEFSGILATVFVLEWFARQLTNEEHLERLIGQFGSSINQVARLATEDLRRRGVLLDGSLKGHEFLRSDLQNVWFYRADLSDTSFHRTDFSGADFFRASLKEAKLTKCKFFRADLWFCDLSGANITDSEFDVETKLPDGTFWSPEIDMSKFTNPNHPDFVVIDRYAPKPK